MSCKRIPVIVPTIPTVVGTSVTLTFPSSITAVTLGETFRIPAIAKQLLGTTVGTEEVVIGVGATTYALVDNLGVIVTSQMLRRAVDTRDEVVAPYMLVQYGVSGTANVFYARRGFCKRRTTVSVVTPPVPAGTA